VLPSVLFCHFDSVNDPFDWSFSVAAQPDGTWALKPAPLYEVVAAAGVPVPPDDVVVELPLVAVPGDVVVPGAVVVEPGVVVVELLGVVAVVRVGLLVVF
jgi:hypothetical protein